MTDRPRYRRHGEGLEFDRASFFTDAVYAIAMTLLVVELRVPGGSDADLAAGLGEEAWAIVGFFFGFILLGRYWMAHHAFWASLATIDGRLVALNLVYLAFVAFIPWPVGLVSRHPHAFSAFALFAAATDPGLAGLLFDRGVGFGQVLLLLAGLCATASIVVRPVARRAAPLR